LIHVNTPDGSSAIVDPRKRPCIVFDLFPWSARASMRHEMRSAAIVALLGLALLAACDKPQPEVEMRPVRTVTAIAGSDGELVSLTGHIRAQKEESLAFRIDGRMIKRHVEVGQAVRPNDLIAELDPLPQRDALHQAQAKLAAAEATLHEATNNMERKRTLTNQGWATKTDYDAAERTFNTAKANLDVAKAQLHEAEDHFGYSELRADAPGVVMSKSAEAGEVVKAGQTIVTVAQDGGTDAVFDVPATLMRQISPDVVVTVSLTDDPRIRTTGRVRETAPQADPTTRSFRVKVGLDETPEAMRLGATVFGQARMLGSKGIELPATALTMVDNQPAVWVVDPKSLQVSLRTVELQRHASSSVVVSKGVEPGELIVTAGVHALRPGQKVRLLGAPS
jgi:membrane fusion protein, multidrug efflux system